MSVLEARFKEFQDALDEPFDDGGNEHGYGQRVRILQWQDVWCH